MKFSNKNQLIILVVAIAILATIVYLLSDALSFSQLKSQASQMMQYVEKNRWVSIFIFISIYYVLCSIPFPFVSVLTILSGFLFGTLTALAITSFASALGACTLFLATRHFFGEWARENLIQRFEKLQISAGSNDFWAAFSVRLIPGMPFFVPSMALAITKLSLAKFYISTQLGLFVTIFVFVNAGSSLATINSVRDVFSQQLVIAMLLVAILPLTVRALAKFIKTRLPES